MTPATGLAEHAHEAAEAAAWQRRRVADLRRLAQHYAERGFAEALRLRELEDEARDAQEAARAAWRAGRG